MQPLQGQVELIAAWSAGEWAYEVFFAHLADHSEVAVVNAFGPDETLRTVILPREVLASPSPEFWGKATDAQRTAVVERALSLRLAA